MYGYEIEFSTNDDVNERKNGLMKLKMKRLLGGSRLFILHKALWRIFQQLSRVFDLETNRP